MHPLTSFPSKYTAGDFRDIQRSFNERLRESVGFLPPKEQLADFLALSH